MTDDRRKYFTNDYRPYLAFVTTDDLVLSRDIPALFEYPVFVHDAFCIVEKKEGKYEGYRMHIWTLIFEHLLANGKLDRLWFLERCLSVPDQRLAHQPAGVLSQTGRSRQSNPRRMACTPVNAVFAVGRPAPARCQLGHWHHKRHQYRTRFPGRRDAGLGLGHHDARRLQNGPENAADRV